MCTLDNAPYHSTYIELLPRKGWRKAAIEDWLTRKRIPWSDHDMIIAELLRLVDPLRPLYSERKMDQMAKQAGHDCELNAIEMVSWKGLGKR